MDRDCERLVFSARASSEGVVLAANDEDRKELMGYVAAEANNEADRRHQKRLGVAFAVLSDAPIRLRLVTTATVDIEQFNWAAPCRISGD